MLKLAAVIGTCLLAANVAQAKDLYGFKGDTLKGSISCMHPNIVKDLADRLDNEESYSVTLRLYEEQGYCVEADLPTVLKKPMLDHTIRTWDGHEAELWETDVVARNPDGNYFLQHAYSIVFPMEMEKNYKD